MTFRLLFPLVLMALPALAATAMAGDLLVKPDIWQHLSVPGKPEAEIVFAPGRADIRSKDGVRFAYRQAPTGVERLDWRWRVSGDYPPSDPSEVDRDDRPVAVHLWLDRPGTDEVLFGTLARFLGFPRVTHVLTYVWGGTAQPGRMVANPHYENGVLVVLRTDAPDNGNWRAESRDVARDLERAFGAAVTVGDIRHIAISTDLDDLGGMAVAVVEGLRSTIAGKQ